MTKLVLLVKVSASYINLWYLLMLTVYGVFIMQVDGNGVVTFDPDLNSGRPAYRIENRHRGELFNMHKHIVIMRIFS